MQTMYSFREDSDRNRKRYHRNVGFSSWAAVPLRGNTGARTRRACCRRTGRWSCWCRCTCRARRPGCSVGGRFVGCKNSRTLSQAAARRCFAASEKRKERGKIEDRLHQSDNVQMQPSHALFQSRRKERKLTNSWQDSGTALVNCGSSSSSSSDGSSQSSFGR